MKRTAALGFMIALGSVCADSSAQSAGDRTLAETLFREAKKLMKADNYAEACPKLAESHRLDPGGGTLLNLAVCHEKEGKTATAWAEFQEALAQAKQDGRQDRVTLATERIAVLEPLLPRVKVVVPDGARIESMVVTVDDNELGEPAWGTAVPVDPGSHVVRAVAPGRKQFESTFEAKASSTRTVEIPVLAPGAGMAPTQPAFAPSEDSSSIPDAPADPGASDGSGQRTLGYVVAGVGVVGLGAGTLFGLKAISKRKESDDECPNDECTDAGVDLNDEARSAATLSNVGFGVGLVGLGVGAYLILSASGDGEKQTAARDDGRLRVVPAAGPGGGGLLVRGAF